jgi:hypothetical protein
VWFYGLAAPAYLLDAHHLMQLLDEQRDEISQVFPIRASYNRQLGGQEPARPSPERILNRPWHVGRAEQLLDGLYRLGCHVVRVTPHTQHHQDALLDCLLHDHQHTPPSVRE